jgi:hypothetical protein
MAFFNWIFKLLLPLVISISIVRSQVNSPLNYYPLEKGNSWQYRSTHIDRLLGSEIGKSVRYYTLNIFSDTTLNNDKLYYVVTSTVGSPVVHPRFQRVDSLTWQVFAFDTSNGGKEYQIDSLSASPRSAFSGCRWSIIKATDIWTVDSQSYFGVRMACRNYLTPIGFGPYIRYTLTYGIGMAMCEAGAYDQEQYQAGSTNDTLVYAKINGKEYGTLVSVHQNKEVVSNFVLYQNFSNPANPATTINYSLPEAYYVSLKVYDVLGRLVTTLVDEWQSRGFHSATFYGNDLSSGVYFYNLKAGPFDQTKKLILLR